MRIIKLFGVGSVLVIAGACGSDSGSGGCPNLSGNYSLSGNCPDLSSCTVSQTGCAVTITCNSGNPLTGSASNSTLSFANSTTHCTGTVDRTTGQVPTVSGSCTTNGSSCTYDATCNSGKCTTANEAASSGGASGTGGAGGAGGAATDGGLDPTCENGADAVCTCEQAAGSDCSVQTLYDACVAKDPSAAPVACFANYVSDDQIDCNAASLGCLPAIDGGGVQTTCDPPNAPNACTACVEGKCCSEWMGCTNATCAGNAGTPGEFVCMQSCFFAGETSIATCTAMCAASGTKLDPTTQALVDCVTKADSNGTQNCSTDCFTEMVQP